jgi:hypothetical protein
MTDTARALLHEITSSPRSGADETLVPRYADRIQAVGRAAFLAEVFRGLADSSLETWMFRLGFCWHELSFEEWKDVLRRIADDAGALYQFVWFASEALAIDAAAMIRSDSGISQVARAVVAHRFPMGGPLPTSQWVQEMLAEHGVDYRAMWRRLASEGAPMRLEGGVSPFVVKVRNDEHERGHS